MDGDEVPAVFAVLPLPTADGELPVIALPSIALPDKPVRPESMPFVPRPLAVALP
jgi:hypothetical protein